MLIDTHCHLEAEAFHADRVEAIARAAAAGVEAILAVGTTVASSEASIRLAAEQRAVWAAVGIHPNHAAEAGPSDWDRIVVLAGQPRVVAIGETGLDRHWHDTPFEMQQDYFDRHIRLSQQLGLPFIVHTRECDADALQMLRAARERGPLQGVMHSFTGTIETAAECLALGMYISFAGMVTFKKSDALRAVAVGVPADRILVETDSPYLSPHPLRGKRNEPANVALTAACLAQARGQDLVEFSLQTTANARRLFRFE